MLKEDGKDPFLGIIFLEFLIMLAFNYAFKGGPKGLLIYLPRRSLFLLFFNVYTHMVINYTELRLE